MNLEDIRSQIPTCQQMVYMNTGWSGPSPRRVVEAVKNRLEEESYNGPTSKPVVETGRQLQLDTVEAVAGLLNAYPEEICITQNTTDGLNLVINGLPWQEGDEIITFGLEHSSVLLPAYSLRHRLGVNIKVLQLQPNESEDSIIQKLASSITNRTRLVFSSHIQYTSGLRMPVKSIRELTRSHGIKMLLDGAQTAGHISLDLHNMDCDFYSIPAQKWLLGPDGVGALYVKKELIPTLQPTRVSGRAALSYDDQGNYNPNNDSLDKFRLTTKSAPLSAGFCEAIKFVQEIGMETVESRALQLATQLKDMLSKVKNVKILSPLEEKLSSGLTAFQITNLSPEDAVDKLWYDHNIVSRQVKEIAAVRISTHFFNSEDELSYLVEAVSKIAS